MIDTIAPAVKIPKAAMSAHTNARRPNPSGCRSSFGRAPRRSAIRRKISLPASAHEWAASATIDADDVKTAATVLATATRTFARKAMTTVTGPGYARLDA